MNTVKYEVLKSFIIQRGLSVQTIELDDRILLYAFEGNLALDSMVAKDDGLEYQDYVANLKAFANRPMSQTSPFANKNVGNKKLYRRKHGMSKIIQPSIDSSFGEISLTVPYALCKIDQIEIVNCDDGDFINLKIYDSVTGVIQQSMSVPANFIDPKKLLNQFGFEVRMPKDFYEDRSQYDADLYAGMVIVVEYFNKGSNAKEIGINYTLHEVR